MAYNKKSKKPKAEKRAATEMTLEEGLAHMLTKSKAAALVTRASESFDSATYLDFRDPKTGTPCLPLEWMFGTRGMITGRLLNMVAEEAVGKTSLVMMFLGMFQKTADCYTIYAETEETPLPPDRILELGADPTKILLNDPLSMRACMENMVEVVKDIRNQVDPEMVHAIVNCIDSVSSLSEKELDRESGEEDGNEGTAQHAREFSKFFRSKLDYLAHQKCALITTVQEKESIGMSFGAKSSKSYLAMRPIKFHSSWILELINITNKEVIEDAEFEQCIRMRCTKNKLAVKGRTVDVMMFRDQRGWDFSMANKHLLFGSYSPFEPGTYSQHKGLYMHDRIKSKTGARVRWAEFLERFYQDEELVMQCRENLKIRGFGFDFESRFQQPAEEAPTDA